MCNALRLQNDPIRALVLWCRLTLIGGLACVALCAAWSGWPVRVNELPIVKLEPAPAKEAHRPEKTRINPKAFAVNLWNPPPQTFSEAVVKAPEPPKPLNVQLIGIINEAGIRKAALYDIEADRLIIVGSGDRIRGNIVKSINEESIELTDGRSTRTLTLEVDRS